jgi:restriction system protein
MAIPDYQSLMRPLLAYAQDGAEKHIRAAFDALAAEFALTPDERQQMLPSGKQIVFENRVHWARTYLDKAGAIVRTKRSHFQITDRGLQLLRDHPSRVGVAELRQFPEFQKFQTARDEEGAPAERVREAPQIPDATIQATPEEVIQLAESQLNESLRGELLERIAEMSPAFFEQLVVDLIVAMGYGGSKSNVAKRIGRSGDEGIDGIVNEDALGLDVVYIQAKRYAPGNTIGREQIQQFTGALIGQGAMRGVFFTTSSFTGPAIQFAEKVPQRVILIDGNRLTQLMMQYGVGVRVDRSVEIRRVDLDYFVQDQD